MLLRVPVLRRGARAAAIWGSVQLSLQLRGERHEPWRVPNVFGYLLNRHRDFGVKRCADQFLLDPHWCWHPLP